MQNTVTVNGVQLTREQVEGALKELNTPRFEPGDLVEFHGIRAIVIGGALEAKMRASYDIERRSIDELWCIDIKGMWSWAKLPSELTLIKKGPIA